VLPPDPERPPTPQRKCTVGTWVGATVGRGGGGTGVDVGVKRVIVAGSSAVQERFAEQHERHTARLKVIEAGGWPGEPAPKGRGGRSTHSGAGRADGGRAGAGDGAEDSGDPGAARASSPRDDSSLKLRTNTARGAVGLLKQLDKIARYPPREPRGAHAAPAPAPAPGCGTAQALAGRGVSPEAPPPHPYCCPYPCPYCTLTPSPPSSSTATAGSTTAHKTPRRPPPPPLVLIGHTASLTPY
jgi:hypothetical protein